MPSTYLQKKIFDTTVVDKKLDIFLPIYAHLGDILFLNQNPTMESTEKNSAKVQTLIQKVVIFTEKGHEIPEFCDAFANQYNKVVYQLDLESIIQSPSQGLQNLKEELKSFSIQDEIVLKEEELNPVPEPEINENLQDVDTSADMDPNIDTEIDASETAEDTTQNLISSDSTLDQQIVNQQSIMVVSLDMLLPLIDDLKVLQSGKDTVFIKELFIHQLLEILFTNQYSKSVTLFCILPDSYIPFLDLNLAYDVILNLVTPDINSRKQLLEQFLKSVAPTKIDWDHLGMETEKWNIAHLRQFCQSAISNYFIMKNSQFDIHPEYSEFNTQFLIDLLSKPPFNQWQRNFSRTARDLKNSTLQTGFLKSASMETRGIADPIELFAADFETQMYQLAASKDFESLMLTLDKLAKGLLLEPYEQRILANYAFLIREEPSKALEKLNQAHRRLERLQLFQSSPKQSETKKNSKAGKDVSQPQQPPPKTSEDLNDEPPSSPTEIESSTEQNNN